MPPKKKVVNQKQTQKQEQKVIVNIGKPTTTRKKKTHSKSKPQTAKANNPLAAPIVINTMPQLPPPPQPLAFAPTNNPLYYSTTPMQQPQRQPEVIRNPPPVAQGQPLQPPPQPVRNQPPVGYMQVPVLPPRRAEQQAQPTPVPPLQPPPQPVRNQPAGNDWQMVDIQVPRLPPRRQPQQQPEVIRNPPPVAQGQPVRAPEVRVEAPRDDQPSTSQRPTEAERRGFGFFDEIDLERAAFSPNVRRNYAVDDSPIKRKRKPTMVTSSTQDNLPKPLPPNLDLTRYSEVRAKLASGDWLGQNISIAERMVIKDIALRLNIPTDERMKYKTIDDEIQRKLLKRQ